METVTITRHDSRFEPLAFVLEARSADPTRPSILGVNVERAENGSSQIWTSVDGRRLHSYETKTEDPLPEGNLRLVSVSKELIVLSIDPDIMGQFPNWRKVVPTDINKNIDFPPIGEIDIGDISFRLDAKKDFIHTRRLAETMFRIRDMTGAAINPAFLLPLSSRGWIVYGEKGPKMTVEFQSGGYKVVMTGINMD